MKLIHIFWAVFVGLLFQTGSYAQCTMACNDLVQVSLPPDGIAIILPDMILDGEDTSCPGPKTVSVFTPEGVSLEDTVTCDYLNLVLNVHVYDDNSGNYCWGTILVEDKLPPILTCADLTVDCTADLSPDSLGFALVTDNCDPNPTLTYSGQPVMQPCTSPYSAILTRIWQASDQSNNMAAPCVQKIYVTRPSLADVVFPLNLDGFQSPPLSCENPDTSPDNTGYPTIGGNPVIALCKMSVTYTDLVLGGCENEQSVLRSWLVLNCCTNEILEHNQIIKVVDDQGPVLACPDTLIFGANGPGCAGTFFLPAITATDNCAPSITFRTLTPWGILNSNGGLVINRPLGSYIVTYEATDGCGNISTCQVVVIITDNVAPVAICDENTVVALSSFGLATLPAAVLDDGSYDACCAIVTFSVKRMDQPAAPFGPSVQFTCADLGGPVMVILKVTDCHGNSNTCMVEVTVQDKTPPAITCPPNVTIACSEFLPPDTSLTGSPIVTDNCGIDTLFFSDVENLSMCNTGTITRTFTVIDVTGFEATCIQIITTVDNTTSQFFFPPDTVVGCDRPLDSLLVGEPEVISDCELFGLNISDDIFPVPCGLKIYRTYTYLDWCSGQDTSYTQFIKLEDNDPPVWDQPLGSLDRYFLCDADLVKPPPPTATDYCTPATVDIISDVMTPGDCPHHFMRVLVYGAQDTCGNVAVPFVINVTVFDTVPPYADALQGLGPFSCIGQVPPPNVNDVTGESDNCFGGVTVEFVSDSPAPVCQGTIVRTYRLTDVCGNDTLITQNILINDNTAPVANPLPALGPFACVNQIPLPNVAVVTGETDNCVGPVTVAFNADSGNPICQGTVTRTYRLTDACGNDTLIAQQILINDNVPPTATWSPEVRDTVVGIACQLFVSVTASAVDNCPGNPVTITNDFNGGGGNASGIYPVGTTLVTFEIEDACGNAVTVQTAVIVVELIPPSNFCMPFNLSLDTNGVVVVPLDSLIADGFLGGSDLCTDVTFSIDPDTLTCDDLTVDPMAIPYTLTVTDAFGNSSICMNQLVLHDPFDVCFVDDTLVVSGLVFNENHVPMPDVEVHLSDNNGMSYAFTTDLGLFLFQQNAMPGTSCMLQPVKDDGLLNGVTTFDLVLLSQHILGSQQLQSPYELIAADVNNSGSITTFDIVALRKVILHIADEFPNNTSWRFIEADYDFPDPTNPFAEDFPESTWLTDMGQDGVGHNFVAVKIGDLNGSASLHDDGETSERNFEGDFDLTAPDWRLKKGGEVQIPVACGGAVDLAALQATFRFDPEKMDFLGATAAGLERLGADNFGEPASGHLTFSWHQADGQPLEAGTTLFYLQFQLLENTSVAEAMTLNSQFTSAIAYKNGGIPLNVRWRIHDAPPVPVDAASFFTLEQNRPNPFSHETSIGFWLKERMPVRLEIVDIAGKKQVLLDETLEAGWHEKRLGSEWMGNSGVYIYQLITPRGTERRKMVFER
ncbi:MAG: hypothetical protein HY842_02070 [Bacteroidetes bacterium]|nr:hypothetical protein [Bacteroidota bacterium]